MRTGCPDGPQRLDIADVELGGQVYLHADAAAVGQHRHVGGNDGGDARRLRCVADGAHEGEVVVINDGIDGQVAAHAALGAGPGHAAEVVHGEAAGRVGPHVEPLDAEVDRVGTGTQGGGQRLGTADGRHYLEIV